MRLLFVGIILFALSLTEIASTGMLLGTHTQTKLFVIIRYCIIDIIGNTRPVGGTSKVS